MRARLDGRVPPELMMELRQGYTMLGDVVLVQLPASLAPFETEIGAAFAVALGARSVLAYEGTEGELREARTRTLWGDEDTETLHREHGLSFRLDAGRLLFSPGNIHERHRLEREVRPGERVVDLFAGVGYFTLPLARAGARVVACEKSPLSARYLRENVLVNQLARRVEVREGDCRGVAPRGIADRVLFGYFPGTEAFLATGLAALKPGGGQLHYHTTAGQPRAVERAWTGLAARPELLGIGADLVSGRVVKSYAPGVAHVALDVAVRR